MWSTKDRDYITEYHQELKVVNQKRIEGRIKCEVLRKNGKCHVNPGDKDVLDKSPPDYLYILDRYQIRIIWEEGQHYHPKVEETAGRIKSVAKHLDRSLDIHLLDDGALCLASPMEMRRRFASGFRLDEFVEELLIPYLCAQTHYAKTKEWLWDELSRGSIGLLEWLARIKNHNDIDIKFTYLHLISLCTKEKVDEWLSQRWRGHFKCLCGLKRKTYKCHPEIIEALKILRNAQIQRII